MPLDRVFSLKGFGTVVTGTLLGGGLRAERRLPGALALTGIVVGQAERFDVATPAHLRQRRQAGPERFDRRRILARCP